MISSFTFVQLPFDLLICCWNWFNNLIFNWQLFPLVFSNTFSIKCHCIFTTLWFYVSVALTQTKSLLCGIDLQNCYWERRDTHQPLMFGAVGKTLLAFRFVCNSHSISIYCFLSMLALCLSS